jgi:hypothetical protein
MSQNLWATIMPFGPMTLTFYWTKKKISVWLALISGTGTALLLYIVRLVSQAIDKKCFQHKMCVKVHK